MKRTQLNFDDRTYFQLVSYARGRKISVSAATRLLVAKQLEKDSRVSKNPLLALAKLGRKVNVRLPKNLSEEHDQLLYE